MVKAGFLNSFSFLSTLLAFTCGYKAHSNTPSVNFTENKGQVTDQNYKARPDILFGGTAGELHFHLRKNGISYQQYFYVPLKKTIEEPVLPNPTTIYRIDVNWLNCNSNAILQKNKANEDRTNYYLAGCPNGINDVSSYREIIYKNIYKGIDLKFYEKEKNLKYDFIIEPDADPKQIQLQFSGATKISLNKKGELVLKTPLGEIIEQAPLVTQNGKKINSNWLIVNNVASFNIAKYDHTQILLIDPGVRQWGTYYGGINNDSGMSGATDASGNVYTAGYTGGATGTIIATSGSHQSVFGGGIDNAFLVKFNSAGVRQWATYYGGSIRDFGVGCALDASGNVFMCGNTLSNNAISTGGCHQPANAGNMDAYLVKFNSSGIRQWGTYYGGPGVENGNGCAADAVGNVYLSGRTEGGTGTVIATSGSQQSNFGGVEDAFLVKFNGSGVRQWATYYGGPGSDYGRGCTTDALGNVYLSGFTDNTNANVIATSGAHQTSYGGGGYDAFLVKFNTSGIRQWGTYYGGAGEDRGNSCKTDSYNNVYLTGRSSSATGIASATSFQNFFSGGNYDAFLVKFTDTGIRKWGTYYGGNGDDEGWSCSVHLSDFVYMAGYTSSSGGTVIATAGSHQTTFGGGTYDAYLVQFDTLGARQWGSYYGDAGTDVANGCHTDAFNNVYLTGVSDSNTGTVIATGGSHQSTYGGGWGDAFEVKFYDCVIPVPPTNTTPTLNLTVCFGKSATLSATSTGTVNWFSTPTSTTILNSGNNFNTSTLSTGTYTFYTETKTCANSITRTPITVTVSPLPSLSIFANPPTICGNQTTTISVSGAKNYTWSTGANGNYIAVSPTLNTNYTVTGTDTLGCTNTKTVSISVLTPPGVTLTTLKDTSCLTLQGGTLISLTGIPSGGVYSGPNMSGNNFNPTALGVFTPMYTYTSSSNGCTNTATVSITVLDCTSINEFQNNLTDLFIYPNPSTGDLTISSNFDVELGVINELGQKIRSITLNLSNGRSADIKNLSSGVYFIFTSTRSVVIKQKLVVIK